MSKKEIDRTFRRLHEQVSTWTNDYIDGEFRHSGYWSGDSEIERLFHAALHWRLRLECREYPVGLIRLQRGGGDVAMENPWSKMAVLVEPQATIGEFRVDFLIRAWTDGAEWPRTSARAASDLGLPRWRKLVVECDGHDFHERTKAQAAKDRSRDRVLKLAGYDVFRFTGSELWRDPWGCAGQVYEWALRGIE